MSPLPPAGGLVFCTADAGHSCDANDGEPCADCVSYLKECAAEAWLEWHARSPLERDPAKYERDMKDAGRRP